MNPDRLAELEDERRFLLRSLADLEREHDAGDVDDEDYATLEDGYTARAAVVLREIDAGNAARPQRRVRRPWASAAWIVGVVALAAGAGWMMARSSGQRVSGQTMTGGQTIDEVSAKLSRARTLTGSDPAGAMSVYEEVLQVEPDNVEARTYAAWLAITSQLGDLDSSIAQLAAVVADEPSYADAHCLYAVAAARFASTPDLDLAKVQGQLCLDNDPPSGMVDMVQGFVDSLASPTDVDGLLGVAVTALQQGDYAGAAEAYRAVLDLDAQNAEARTYTAWLLALSSQGASVESATLALDQAVASFERVIADNPAYADAHCLFAVTAARLLFVPDLDLAAAQAAACRANNPSADLEGLVAEQVDPLRVAGG